MPRRTHVLAAASAALIGLILAVPAFAAQSPRGAAEADPLLQQATGTPTPTASPGRGPQGRGPENAPGRQDATATGTPTRGTPGRPAAKTPPTLPPNASERARTVVQAVFERNQQVRDLIARMRAARGLPNAGADEEVTDDFARGARQKRTGDAVVDTRALTPEQREQFQAELKAIMAAFAETLRQAAGTASDAAAAPTATPTASPTPTTTPTAQP